MRGGRAFRTAIHHFRDGFGNIGACSRIGRIIGSMDGDDNVLVCRSVRGDNTERVGELLATGELLHVSVVIVERVGPIAGLVVEGEGAVGTCQRDRRLEYLLARIGIGDGERAGSGWRAWHAVVDAGGFRHITGAVSADRGSIIRAVDRDGHLLGIRIAGAVIGDDVIDQSECVGTREEVKGLAIAVEAPVDGAGRGRAVDHIACIDTEHDAKRGIVQRTLIAGGAGKGGRNRDRVGGINIFHRKRAGSDLRCIGFIERSAC